jgi:hypothetical protein
VRVFATVSIPEENIEALQKLKVNASCEKAVIVACLNHSLRNLQPILEDSALNTSFDNPALTRAALALLGLVLSIYVGTLVGESDWTILGAVAAILILASLAQVTVRNLVAICLALATLDFWMAPTGFKLSPMEQTGVIAAACWLLVCWRRNFNPSAPTEFFQLKSYRFFQNVVFVSAAYAVTHFVYNYVSPYDELAFGWKGASKAYLQTFGAFIMVVFLARAKLLYPMGPRSSIVLLRIFLGVLVISVAIGVVRAVTVGPEPETGLSMQEKSEALRLFMIPGLNAHDSVYTLRQLGPAAVLIGSVFFFMRPRGVSAFLPMAIAGLGFLGSLVSAGRASLLFAGAFMVAGMFFSKRGPLAFAAAGAVAVAVAILVMLPDQILKETPWHLQRSVAYLRPDLRTQATEGIEGSSDMRWNYFKFAWDHYTSGDARLILFGRSVGQLDSVDVLSFVLYNELAQMEFAVRRLGTHNGMTDLLLGWGLIGYLLNLAMCLSCCIMLFSYLRKFRHKSHGSCWVFISGVFLSFWLIYTHVGGSFVWPLAIWLVIAALSQIDGLLDDHSRPQEDTRLVRQRAPESSPIDVTVAEPVA